VGSKAAAARRFNAAQVVGLENGPCHQNAPPRERRERPGAPASSCRRTPPIATPVHTTSPPSNACAQIMTPHARLSTPIRQQGPCY